MSSKLNSTPDMVFILAEKLYLRSQTDKWLVCISEYYTDRARKLENNGWKARTGMTQVDKLIKHLKKTGSITQREAYLDYGIQSFHRRLTDLRDRGYELVGYRKRHPTTGQEYTRYYLTPAPITFIHAAE